MSNIIIPREHRATQKEHPADKAIREAAREIDEHKWIDETPDERREAAGGLGLALGFGHEGAAVGEKPCLEEFRQTHDQAQMLDTISCHPQVEEALEKMRREVRELKGHELVEMNCALRELTEAKERKNRWDGQGRWMGHENEEMRYGQVMSPPQFMRQLQEEIGKRRVKLSEHIVFPNQSRKSGLSALLVRNPLWDGRAQQYVEGERIEAGRMEQEGRKHLRKAQQYRLLGKDAAADREFQIAAGLAEDATRMLMHASAEQQLAQPEYLRVGTLQWPLGTEWMIMEFTEWGTVYKPKFYGWRTALLTMLRSGAITESEAHLAFPLSVASHGEAGAWYLQQIYDMKLAGAPGGTVQ
jgi:hypothetical protein